MVCYKEYLDKKADALSRVVLNVNNSSNLCECFPNSKTDKNNTESIIEEIETGQNIDQMDVDSDDDITK